MSKEVFIFEPHNMLISRVTNCGKTHYTLDLLEKEYRGKFDNIIIFCPTYLLNTTYDRKWIFRDTNVIIINPEAVKNYLNITLKFVIEVYIGSNTLFIIDDCANLHDTKRKATELCNLAFSGRHYGITTWVIIQKYNSIVKDYRENIRMLVLFFNKDEVVMKQAFEENDIIPKEKRKEIIQHLKDKKGSKLVLRLQNPFNFLIFLNFLILNFLNSFN